MKPAEVAAKADKRDKKLILPTLIAIDKEVLTEDQSCRKWPKTSKKQAIPP